MVCCGGHDGEGPCYTMNCGTPSQLSAKALNLAVVETLTSSPDNSGRLILLDDFPSFVYGS